MFTYYCISFFCTFACNQNKEKEEKAENLKEALILQESAVTPVKTLLINTQVFNRELFANGKLKAIKKANLNFRSAGLIQSVEIKEVMRVHQGQVVATLDQMQQERDYRQAELKHKQALLDYQDQVLRAGYQLQDTAVLNK